MTVTSFARKLPYALLAQRFESVEPVATRSLSVYGRSLEVDDPCAAGKQFVELCKRTMDDDPLPGRLGRYLPWLNPLRKELRRHVDDFDVERAVGNLPGTLSGVTDFLGNGAMLFPLEAKVVATRLSPFPHPRHMAQLAGYCQSLRVEFPTAEIVPALAYVDLVAPRVLWFEFECDEVLVDPIRDLIAEAAA